MIGAVIGDIWGECSRTMLRKPKEDITLNYSLNGHFTDDTVQTVAIALALLRCHGDYSILYDEAVIAMREVCRAFPAVGHGRGILHWLQLDDPRPYNSFGNGSAMRVSGCAWAGQTLEQVLSLSKVSSSITHSHPRGIQGAQAVASAIFLARTGHSKEEIKDYVQQNFYKLDFTLAQIQPSYHFNATCQASVPQALQCFFESESFEDALKNVLYLGGDSDTIGAICCSVAEAFYGVPAALRSRAFELLDPRLAQVLLEFEKSFGAAQVL